MATGTVAVSGAAGFVGRHIVAALLKAGYSVRALVRDAERAREVLPTDGRLMLVVGDVLEAGKSEELVSGCAACVNAVGILRAEGKSTFKGAHIDAVRALTKACEAKGVSRFVHISSLGVSELGKAEYQTSKAEGERLVRGSSLAWTILRPSLIHGAESDFIGMLAGLGTGLEAPYIFMPYFTRWQTDKRIPMGGEMAIDPVVEPVHVDDVAAAVGGIAREGSVDRRGVSPDGRGAAVVASVAGSRARPDGREPRDQALGHSRARGGGGGIGGGRGGAWKVPAVRSRDGADGDAGQREREGEGAEAPWDGVPWVHGDVRGVCGGVGGALKNRRDSGAIPSCTPRDWQGDRA
jgi:uncharacterized protein YbjT (DUF2867 family)